MKIPHILYVAYYKLNGVHHCFIMKVLKVLDRFFHVYAINVIVTTCWTIFLAYFTMLSPICITLMRVMHMGIRLDMLFPMCPWGIALLN